MPVVEDTCLCGATFRVDERGSVYAAIKHATWLNAHAVCRASTNPVPLGAASSGDGPALDDVMKRGQM